MNQPAKTPLPNPLRIATRRSRLALAQTRFVAEALQRTQPDLKIEEVQIETRGDQILDRPLAEVGGKGLFVSEVEQALLEERADLAVHSMKDLPSELAAGLTLAAIPAREDPRDVLVTSNGDEIDALEAGSRIGTSSLRRQCQLQAHRPDLAFKTLRGNVDTRLRKLDEGPYDAIVLALAGLRRLQLDADRKFWVIPKTISIPAVGQGALGIEVRADDASVHNLVATLDDPKTRVEVEAERALLAKLEGSCKIPVAGHAVLEPGGRFTLHGMVGDVHGTKIVNGATDTYLAEDKPSDPSNQRLREQARQLGTELGANLLSRGAGELIREALAAEARHKAQGNGGGRFGRWQ